ncbi:MAG: hypothetical protein ACJ8IR_13240 [Alphaproteobacteria bacterium]|jgi:hypothetical protein
MVDNKGNPEQDPAEGSRETVERQLNQIPENGNGSGSIRKPDMPSDGPRGEANTRTATPTV